MMNSIAYLEAYRADLADAVDKVDLRLVDRAIEWFREAREAERDIFIFGNGGSATTASHFVCDMVKGASLNRPMRFRIHSLSDSLPTITAYSNDIDYEVIFVEQLKNFAKEGDLVVGISGSGNSANVVKALEYAGSIGCRTIALTGRDGGKLGPLGDLEINVPNSNMGRIENVHMAILHMISYYFIETKG